MPPCEISSCAMSETQGPDAQAAIVRCGSSWHTRGAGRRASRNPAALNGAFPPKTSGRPHRVAFFLRVVRKSACGRFPSRGNAGAGARLALARVAIVLGMPLRQTGGSCTSGRTPCGASGAMDISRGVIVVVVFGSSDYPPGSSGQIFQASHRTGDDCRNSADWYIGHGGHPFSPGLGAPGVTIHDSFARSGLFRVSGRGFSRRARIRNIPWRGSSWA